MYPENVKAIKFPEWMEPDLRRLALKLEIDRCRAEIRDLRSKLRAYTKQRRDEATSRTQQKKGERVARGFGKNKPAKSKVSPNELSSVSK